MTKKLEDHYKNQSDVVIFHLQTVFEGERTNTPERGPKEAQKFDIKVPVGFDAHVDGTPFSLFMIQYGTGGTPWTTIIDKEGVVRYNSFTPMSPKGLFQLVDHLRQ